LLSQSESSLTSVTSGVTYANGVPTDWFQSDTANSTLTPSSSVNGVLAELGITGLTATLAKPLLQPIVNTINGSPSSNSQTTNASGTFTGQVSTGGPSCTSQPILYSGPLTSTFNATATDILQTAGTNGGTTNIAMSDSVIICGTTPSGIASITPLTPGTQLVSSTAAGASALFLMQ